MQNGELQKGRFVPLNLTDNERAILTAPPELGEVDIRPDNGAVYMPEVFIRSRLNKAFGPGQWTLWENGPPRHIPEIIEVLYDATLIVRDSPVARARGGKRWVPPKKDAPFRGMTFATAAESAKSECLRRCAKDLGVGSELWDPAWREAWTAENAAIFEVKNEYTGRTERQWHRKDRPPRDAMSGGRRPSRPGPKRDNSGRGAPSGLPDKITPAQIKAIKHLAAGVPADMLNAQLVARNVTIIEALTKAQASEIIAWAQAERNGD